MKQVLLTVSLVVLCLLSFAQQPFEGEVIYHNIYKSRSLGVTDAQLSARLGSEQHWYVKGGNYKSTANGASVEWLLYLNNSHRLYLKAPHSPAALWKDVSTNPDTVLRFELHKNAATILGYKCDELVLHCKSGVQRYYFSSKLPLDSKLFTRHQYGNWYAFVSRSHALALKQIIEFKTGIMESVATVVKPMKLNRNVFALPAGLQTMPMANHQ
jgi:hypothetical protein